MEYSGINLDAEIPGLEMKLGKLKENELWTKRVYLANRNSIRPIPTDDKLTEQQNKQSKMLFVSMACIL